MAELSPEQFIAKLQEKINLISKENKPLLMAAISTESLRVDRIFHEGLNQNGSSIGTYNTSMEIYASDDQLRKKGTNKGKTGKPTKTSYYKSYRALKIQQGFNASGVNFRLTNNFQSDYANAPLAKNSDRVPTPKPFKVDVNHYVVKLSRQENVDKLEGLEAKYGNVFDFSEGEKKAFFKAYNFEANRILNL
tara:strand:- start:2577 stop:3152 length:576 start_codon:yes stop_codon:yes gene_type:complete